MMKNPKYRANKKNGGVIPAVSDLRVTMVPIACGRCMECRKAEARKWQLRLIEDIRENKNGYMVTLTFSNESIKELVGEIEKKTEGKVMGYDMDNAIATMAMRRFNERWRKEHKKAVRHWTITELGHKGTENIHIHGIIWTDKPKEEITKHWKYGYTWIGEYVSEKTVNYIVKYVHKQDADHKEYKPKVLTSAGIGNAYTKRQDAETNRYKEGGQTREYYRTRQGIKMKIPIYWRNKIYSEEEREKLWLEKLDKNERWVDGIRVDISNGEEEYYKILEEARNKNNRLGYQQGKVDWSRKKYEEERRTIMQEARIKGDASGGSGGRQPESVNDSLRSESAIKPSKNWD